MQHYQVIILTYLKLNIDYFELKTALNLTKLRLTK